MLDAYSGPPPAVQGREPHPPTGRYDRSTSSRAEAPRYPARQGSLGRVPLQPPPNRGYRRHESSSRHHYPPQQPKVRESQRPRGPPAQRPPRKSSIAAVDAEQTEFGFRIAGRTPPPHLPLREQASQSLRNDGSRPRTSNESTRVEDSQVYHPRDGSFSRARSQTTQTYKDPKTSPGDPVPTLERARTVPYRVQGLDHDPERPRTATEVINSTIEDLPPVPSLRVSTSIPDYRRLKAACPSPRAGFAPSEYGNSRPGTPGSHTYPMSSFQTTAGSVTDSFRSGLTFGTSVLDTSSTERSSVITKRSSGRGLAIHSPRMTASWDDDDFSIDDYIALYARGFEDEPPNKPLQPPLMTRRTAHSPLSVQDDFESPPMSLSSTPSLRQDLLTPKSAVLTPTLSRMPTSPAVISSGPDIASSKSSPPVQPSPNPPRDRYGFKKESQYTTLAQYDAWDAQYSPYLARRRVKWEAFMKSHGMSIYAPIRFPPRSDKTKRFIRKGIPPDWRGAAWFWYSGGIERVAQNPYLYQRLVGRTEAGELSENDRELIERDLHRTFPDCIKFKPDPVSHPSDPYSPTEEEIPMIQSLRRVLGAFAIHHPKIGYCQSLNFLAGNLLLFLDGDEEKSFHLLCILTSEYLPGTHGIALEGANVDIGVLMSTLQDSMPSLYAKLADHSRAADLPPNQRSSKGSVISSLSSGSSYGTNTNKSTSHRSPSTSNKHHASSPSAALPTVSLATTAWFMSCYVSTLPIEPTLRVWDCLFYEGSKTLFRVALGIFKLCAPQIDRIRDPMEVFQLVQTLPRGLLDANALMEAGFGGQGAGRGLEGRGLLSGEEVERRRESGRRSLHERRSGAVAAATGNGVGFAKATGVVGLKEALAFGPEPLPPPPLTPAASKAEKPSLSRAASFKKLTRLKSVGRKDRKDKAGTPPLPTVTPT